MPNVYVDASGNPGSRQNPTESKLYVVCTVYMGSDEADEYLHSVHSEVAVDLAPRHQEFKSSKNLVANSRFIEEMLNRSDWGYSAALAFRDELLYSGLQYRLSCLKWFLKRALLHMRPALKSGTVFIDQGSSEGEDEGVLTYLRKITELAKYASVQNAQMVRSVECPGVQLADLIAGHVARLYKTQSFKAQRAYAKLRPRELIVWKYPFDAESNELPPRRDAGEQSGLAIEE